MVESILRGLDTSKASGPDDTPSYILKECASALAPSLSQLFNLSMATGDIPSQWKSANVVPVHKKESKRNVSNYRPVSLLCIVSKVMERCVFNSIYPFLQNQISEHQHGFVSGRSSATQLSEMYHTVGSTLDNRGQTDVVFLDFAKAFDSVPHELLLHKLMSFGINGRLLNWFKTYVSNRKQRVIIEGEHSKWLPVLSGVPQGSILGPLLFVLYINDLPECTLSHVKLFADDAKCYRKIETLQDCHDLQKDIDALFEWSKKWGLEFSPRKCKVMSVMRCRNGPTFNYCLNGVHLERVEKFVDLGVTITSNLSYHDHVKAKVNKAKSMAFLIHRTTGNLVAPNIKVRLFETLVRSHLEYCSQVWSPHNKGDIVLLEQVQRRFTKSVLYNMNMSYKERLLYLGLLPLSFRREISDLLFLYKCIYAQYNVDFPRQQLLVPIANANVRLRSNNIGLLFTVPRCKTTTFQSSYYCRAINLWNSLPQEARSSSSLHDFRNHVKSFYKSKLANLTSSDTGSWVSDSIYRF